MQIEAIYSAALYLYPQSFRMQYASAMLQSLRDALADKAHSKPRLYFLLTRDLTTSLVKEHLSMFRETFLRPALIFNALTLGAIATVLALAIYVIPQQVLRQSANDPQIELAENLAQSLKSGTPVEFALPADLTSTPSNSHFFITSDGKGQPATPDKLIGKLPPPPPGTPQNVEIRVKKSGDATAKAGQQTETRTITMNVVDDSQAKGAPQNQTRTMVIQNDKAGPGLNVTTSQDAHGKMNVQVDSLSGKQSPLTAGTTTITTTIPDSSIDLAHTLSPFLIAYDADGKPIASQARLDGKIPAPPKGVFDSVRTKGEERVTWAPQPGARFAAVIIHIPAGENVKESFVLAGRSLREVEIREKQLGDLAFFNWLLMMGLIVVGTLAFGWFTRPKPQIAATN